MNTHRYIYLKNNVQNKTLTVGIVGIGYVGSALAHLSADAGFQTIGFDINQEKIDKLVSSYKKNLSASKDFSLLKQCSVICICVPTPVYKDKKPDFRPLESASRTVADNLQKNQLVILESSVNPGATRNIVLPMLEASGLRVGKDFFLSFSPERVDPGNKEFALQDIPKVIGGYDERSAELTAAFYSHFIKRNIVVSSLEAAELAKILENTYRFVNISLINEISDYASAIGVDIWEVIAAASTKPFGFQAHYPGPGVGGHCIPVDPYYLLEDARKKGITLRMVKEAGKVNDRRPKKIVRQTLEILSKTNGQKRQHKILLVGVSYKSDVDDVRESPALKIWDLFAKQGISVSYYDPYVLQINGYSSVDLKDEVINEVDVIVITTNHSNIPYGDLVKHNKPILDTRNVFKKLKNHHIFRI